jgi:DNA gyrase subunit A
MPRRFATLTSDRKRPADAGTQDTDGRRVLPIDLEDEMRRSYLDYSMSVNVSRALPDVRDGLKPVHRRIMYSMHELKLTYNRPYKKCATVVGDVLGKYHPHGDLAVYDAMVRMAQEFSLRHTLIDGQGNFGSVDGDPAAAYRYTESRISRIGGEMLTDLEKETVDFVPNFDQKLSEPVVLPSGIPNLLVNGSTGIGVGMATNIPPHNLREIVDACCLLIGNPDAGDDDLLEAVKGPDFPTGAKVMGKNGIRNTYLTGRGRILVRGRSHTEEASGGRESIVITEIPYQVNKASLVSRIAELVKQKKITDIADLRDESDREGMRILVVLKKDAISEVVLNQLYKHTELEVAFSANMLALVDNTPVRLSLREMLGCYIEHRHEVVYRRTCFDLARAKDRAHIVEGLIRAQEIIDDVIRAIRESSNQDEARPRLISEFGFSEKQAQAILDMRLGRLTALDRTALQDEMVELRRQIADLTMLYEERPRRMELVAAELREMAEMYGEDRRTKIEPYAPGDFLMEDLIPDDMMVILVSHEGYIKRLPLDTYRSQHRGGRGITGAATKEEDFIEQVFVASNHSFILFFTNYGMCHWLKVYGVPEAMRSSKGKAVVNLIGLQEGERPVAQICVKDFDQAAHVVMVSSSGMIKKSPLGMYSRPRRGGIKAIRLDEGSELVGASLTTGESEILLAKRDGHATRFSENDVRPMGRNTRGVIGTRLSGDDTVVGMVVVSEAEFILTVTANGYGKRTPVSEYRKTGRAGKGVVNIRCSDRNGPVVAVKAVSDEDELFLVSAGGLVIRIPVSDIRTIGRYTQGVRLMNLPDGDRVVDAAIIRTTDEED